MLLINVTLFQHKEFLFVFLIRQVLQELWWILSSCVYIRKFSCLLHFWRTTLADKLFLVGRFFLFSFEYIIPISWPTVFLLRKWLKALWNFLCMWQVTFFFSCCFQNSLWLLNNLVITCPSEVPIELILFEDFWTSWIYLNFHMLSKLESFTQYVWN